MGQKLDVKLSKVWEFNSIKMGYAVTSYPQLNAKYSAANNNDTVRLHMGLKGDYAFKYDNLGKTYDLIGGHHNIMYSEGIKLELENKSLEVETFGIEFPKDIFVDLVEDEDLKLPSFCTQVSSGQSAIFSENWGSITATIQTTIDEIIANPYNGKLEDLYLYAKSIELLVLCIANYKKVEAKVFSYIKSKADQEAIIAARDFISSRVSDPPDLSEIARAVGVNEFKLKYGFKEMFGSTLFGYLTEKRLHLATLLIKDTNKAIFTIAEELGYSSPQHFSSQYKNRFGKSPSEIRKTS